MSSLFKISYIESLAYSYKAIIILIGYCWDVLFQYQNGPVSRSIANVVYLLTYTIKPFIKDRSTHYWVVFKDRWSSLAFIKQCYVYTNSMTRNWCQKIAGLSKQLKYNMLCILYDNSMTRHWCQKIAGLGKQLKYNMLCIMYANSMTRHWCQKIAGLGKQLKYNMLWYPDRKNHGNNA